MFLLCYQEENVSAVVLIFRIQRSCFKNLSLKLMIKKSFISKCEKRKIKNKNKMQSKHFFSQKDFFHLS